MPVAGLSASPPNCVSPGSAPLPQQASASAPAGSASRMRWTTVENKAPLAGQLSRNSSQSSSQGSSSPIAKLPTLTPLPTRTLAAFEKLQQKLERCDKQDLANYSSVLRVPDHTLVLGTDAIMKLPGQIRDAKASVKHAIDALKTCKSMPSRDQLLAYAKTHNKAAAVLEKLKRSHPLPPPRLHEADAVGNLIRGGERSSESGRKNARWRTAPPSQPSPLHAPVAPAHPRNVAVITANRRLPHEQSYVESLRSSAMPPCPVHSPEKPATKLNAAAAKQAKNARDALWQSQQIEREKKLWSGPALEKSNMADALEATEEAMKHYIEQRSTVLPPGKLDALSKEVNRLAALKKKCKELDPKDTSKAARACRAQAGQENIRARNLLGSSGLRAAEKARMAERPVSKPIIESISQRQPSERDAAILQSDVKPVPLPTVQTTLQSPPRKRWTVPTNPFTPIVSRDQGYISDSSCKDNPDAPFLIDDTLPAWARRGLDIQAQITGFKA